MNGQKTTIITIVICLLYLLPPGATAQESLGSQPTTNNGKKWRIAYVEGGPYANYQVILGKMTLALMELGWIETEPLPESKDESETATLWNFLSTQIKSEYLEFLENGYWSAEWDDDRRSEVKKAVTKRLQTPNDIDLMLGFGTWTGQDFANNEHDTPLMVISASNALRAGIIKSVDDSGFDHVHAWIDPFQAIRGLKLFYEIAKFKKLGIAYEDDSDGRSYAHIDDVRKLSKKFGYEVIECKMPLDSAGTTEEEIALARCYKELAPKIDAIFMTDYAGLTKKNIKKLLEPLFNYKIPSFAQTRYDLVKHGVLMGAARADFRPDARFYAETAANIFNGAKPRDLPQVFESPLKIVINMESAKQIGIQIPIDVLASAFEIHKTIVDPKE